MGANRYTLGYNIIGCIALILITQAQLVSGNQLQVTYGIATTSFQEQKPLMMEQAPHGAIDQQYLSPVVTKTDKRFQYACDLTFDTPLSILKLSLNYLDGGVDGFLGVGWNLVMPFLFEEEIRHNILTPDIGVFGINQTWSLYIEGEQIPVQRSTKQGKPVYKTEPTAHGVTYSFIDIGQAQDPVVVPCTANLHNHNVDFTYALKEGLPILQRIDVKNHRMGFEYDSQKKGLSSIKIESKPLDSMISGETSLLKQWFFSYSTEDRPGGSNFLVDLAFQSNSGPSQHLSFTYGSDRSRSPNHDLEALFKGEVSSLWKRGEPWPLAEKLSLKTNKGLRFFEIDKSKPIDLVNAKEDSLKSWKWDNHMGWLAYDAFAPARKLIHSNARPAGSQFSTIWKSYPKGANKHDTNGYQSLVTSYYLPDDNGRLTYHNHVCFPNIVCKAHRCSIAPDANGNIWDCDDDQALQLPFPLQYEGRMPWPMNQPGIRPRETMMNQGAQFVPFGPYRNGIHFYAIWLRYVDKTTGQPLLGEHRHRHIQNRQERYNTEWYYANGKRNVGIEICQAFWGKKGLRWREADKTKPQWIRLDIDKQTGRPNGDYTLPWHGPSSPDLTDNDPNFHYHYEGFRNVSFASLEPGQTYAIIHGTSCKTCPAESKRPQALHIYKLKRRKWVKVAKNSSFYGPRAMFDSKKLMFIDINNDGYDDCIQADRRPAKVFLNIKRLNQKNAWKECPPLQLQNTCNLMNDCRFMALKGDGDKDLDIFIGDGSIIYYNLSQNSGARPSGYMHSFTDETGKKRLVNKL